MKILFIILYFTSFLSIAFSQKLIRIIDSNNSPIEYVYCHSIDDKIRMHSDNNGEIKFLNTNETEIFIFEKNGFEIKKIDLDTLKDNTIILNEKNIELEEISIKSKVDFQTFTLNKNKPIIKNLIGFQNKSLKGLHFSQFVSRSDFLKYSKILDLNIHSCNSNTILNIHFLESDKFGNPSNQINNEVLVFVLDKKGWNKLDISNYNIKIPENGVFIEYEIFEKEITIGEKFQGVLSGCPISERNIYPLLRKDTLTNLWKPVTYLTGEFSPNLVFTLNVLTTKTRCKLINEDEKRLELKNKKIDKVFKNSDYSIETKSKELPNNSIEKLLESTLTLLKAKKINYIFYHFFYLDDKKELIETLELVNNEEWKKNNLNNATLIIETALNTIQKDGDEILISDGVYIIPVQINRNDFTYKVLVKVKFTSEGWKYFEEEILISK